MSTPGAWMSTHGPKLLKKALVSYWSVAATVNALGADAARKQTHRQKGGRKDWFQSNAVIHNRQA